MMDRLKGKTEGEGRVKELDLEREIMTGGKKKTGQVDLRCLRKVIHS